MKIQPIPTTYRDVRFTSTLEADWAATLDWFGITWQYEPEAVRLNTGQAYRPDFYLPALRTWCEVKGPHDERLDKTVALQDTLTWDEWDWASELVVVLRPSGPGGTAVWHGTRVGQDIVMYSCPECGQYGFMDFNGVWSCRIHMRVTRDPNKFWMADGGALYRPGEVPFTRAPRPGPQRIGDVLNDINLKGRQ